MSNLGPREKYLIIVFGIGLAILIIYLAGIKPLSDKNYDLRVEQQQLQARLEYYKALQQSNEAATSEIRALESEISDIEGTFIPEINTEALEQYVLNVFEENDCPYLASVGSESIASPSFLLPDGSVAEETLNIKRVNVIYSTTDGFNIAEYNRDEATSLIDLTTGHITEDQAAIDAFIDGIVWQGTEGIHGYEEFITSLKAIKDENPDCIKVSSISIESISGFILMSASIDFYSANFIDRVSAVSSTAPYYQWAGDASYATGAGMIGLPMYVDNPDSAWYGYCLPSSSASAGTRPFASAFSSAYFNSNIISMGVPSAIDLEGAGNNQPNDEDPGDEVDPGDA